MALIAEEVVMEWLNRQGFFTIRGVRYGRNQEMDILAVKLGDGKPDLRHYEVQASFNPMGYIFAGGAGATKRFTGAEVSAGVKEWIAKKFDGPKQREVREKIADGEWSYHFVVAEFKYEDKERAKFEEAGIKVINLRDIIAELNDPKKNWAFKATGKDLTDLIEWAAEKPAKK